MVGSTADGCCGVWRGDRRQRLDPRPEQGGVARRPRRAPGHSICEPADVRSRGQAESGARARRSLAAARRSHRLSAPRPRSAGRADRLPAAGVLEDRSPARLYRARTIRGRCISIHRSRSPMCPARRCWKWRRTILSKAWFSTRSIRRRRRRSSPPTQLPDLPRGGEHARRARHDRAQPHRGRGRQHPAADRRRAPSIIRRAIRIDGAAGTSPRRTRRRRISSWRTWGTSRSREKGTPRTRCSSTG